MGTSRSDGPWICSSDDDSVRATPAHLRPVLCAPSIELAARAIAKDANRPLVSALGRWANAQSVGQPLNLAPLSAAVLASRSDCVAEQVAVILDAGAGGVLPPLRDAQLRVLSHTLEPGARSDTKEMLSSAVAEPVDWSALCLSADLLAQVPPCRLPAVPTPSRWAAKVAVRVAADDGTAALTALPDVAAVFQRPPTGRWTLQLPRTVGELVALGREARNCLADEAASYATQPVRVFGVRSGTALVAVGHVAVRRDGRWQLAQLLGPGNTAAPAEVHTHVCRVLRHGAE